MPKTYAIGDIHGCNQQLIALLSTLNIQSDDTLIFLGDVIDRGADSKGVLDTIMHYQTLCRAILIKGNHEEMMRISQILAKIWWYRNPTILWRNH